MGDDPRKIRNGDLWCWQWGDWVSPAFAYLEDRPWTPVEIGDRLCFVASDTADQANPDAVAAAKWCVVWGDERGPWFDDVSNLTEHAGQPVYVAALPSGGAASWVVVWGDRKSQPFDHQITVQTEVGGVTVRIFDPRRGATGPAIPINWRSLEN